MKQHRRTAYQLGTWDGTNYITLPKKHYYHNDEAAIVDMTPWWSPPHGEDNVKEIMIKRGSSIIQTFIHQPDGYWLPKWDYKTGQVLIPD